MKTGVKDIIGNRITGIIVKHAKDSQHRPSSMVILTFEDDTHYEFYTHTGRLRPRQVWHMKDVAQLREWGEDQLWTELIAWLDEEGEARVQRTDSDGNLKDV